MPIYEFYCESCHTVFNFFSARAGTVRQPSCPKCDRPELPRRPSSFATLRHRGEDAGDDPFGDVDEGRLEGAMDTLLREAEGLENDEDPRTMARLMRRFSDLTGLELGDKMQELVSRMEAGEDPESLEQEVDGAADDDDPADLFQLKKALGERRGKRPRVDEELYFL